MVNESRSINEQVRDEIIMAMRYHVDETTMIILKKVLNKSFADVEMIKTKMLPSTTDDVNTQIIELFKVNKAPKLSEKTITYYLNCIKKEWILVKLQTL